MAIEDCKEHMFEGGRKDASYIATLMEDVIEKYDPNKTLTDIFYFDGAGNVQKAGRILEQRYPRSYCFHGGEHVVSLYFDDLAKMRPVKVIEISLFYYFV